MKLERRDDWMTECDNPAERHASISDRAAAASRGETSDIRLMARAVRAFADLLSAATEEVVTVALIIDRAVDVLIGLDRLGAVVRVELPRIQDKPSLAANEVRMVAVRNELGRAARTMSEILEIRLCSWRSDEHDRHIGRCVYRAWLQVGEVIRLVGGNVHPAVDARTRTHRSGGMPEPALIQGGPQR
jgi:hypothetical protein